VRTADLIERLSSEDIGSRPNATMLLLVPLAAGCLVSFVVMLAWLGLRPDLSRAIGTSAYWIKFAYTLALAAIFFWLTERLSRPGAATARPRSLLVIPLAIMALVAVTQLAAAPEAARAHLLMGASYNICPWRIAVLSLPILVGAGAAGAWVYAFHCDESAAPFVAIWYTLGIAAVGVAGGALGKWLLRW